MKMRPVIALVAVASLAGCEGMNKQMMGAGIGATACGVGGGLLARAAGLSKGASVSVGLLSAGACGLAGSELGKYLDEQDRKKHQEAVAKALESGESQAWTNPQSGASGQIQIKEASLPPTPAPQVSTPKSQAEVPTEKSAPIVATAPPQSAPVVVSASNAPPQGPVCRTVSQTIRLKDGTTKTEDLTACRDANGEWKAKGA